MKITQRQVVEVIFRLPPDGKLLKHPCVVLSNDVINQEEEGFTAVMMTSDEFYKGDEYSFELEDYMFNKKPAVGWSAVRMHLIGNFINSDVLRNSHTGTEMKKDAFERMLTNINKMVFNRR